MAAALVPGVKTLSIVREMIEKGGSLDEALELARSIHEAEPKDNALDAVARVFIRTGKLDEAQSLIEEFSTREKQDGIRYSIGNEAVIRGNTALGKTLALAMQRSFEAPEFNLRDHLLAKCIRHFSPVACGGMGL